MTITPEILDDPERIDRAALVVVEGGKIVDHTELRRLAEAVTPVRHILIGHGHCATNGAAAEVPFLFKQWGGWCPTGNLPGNRYKWMIVDKNGNTDTPDRHPMDQDGEVAMERVGKKAAGRHLDGVIHDEYPVKP